MRPVVLSILVSAMIFVSAKVSPADTLVNPPLKTKIVGSEGKFYRWSGGEPVIEGNYGAAGDVYTLSGNGMGVYWCHDACAFAYVDKMICGDFTFTARVKSASIPGNGVGQVGIMVKGRLGMMEPVLSLRWVTYWSSSKGSGLTWFNRITPSSDMLPVDNAPAEKSCHGTGQGCLGKGLVNAIEGYPTIENLWLRVKRTTLNGVSKYYLYARSGNAEWKELPSIAGTHNACGGDPLTFVPNMPLPHFMVPEDQYGNVYVGLFTALVSGTVVLPDALD